MYIIYFQYLTIYLLRIHINITYSRFVDILRVSTRSMLSSEISFNKFCVVVVFTGGQAKPRVETRKISRFLL